MKVTVEYNVKITETIDWPDDERDAFTYENLEANLDPSKGMVCGVDDITSIHVDDKEHYF